MSRPISRPLTPTILAGALLAVMPSVTGRAEARGKDGPLELTYPGKSWSLFVKLPGCKMKRPRAYADGSGIMVEGLDKKTGMNVSIFLEKAPRPGGARVCRDFYWSRVKDAPVPVHSGKVSFTERANMAIIDSVDPNLMGMNVSRKNVNAYLSHDGVWIDVHLSMMPYGREQAPAFEAILRSVRIGKSTASRP
jgi:hypothetical protein